MPANTLGPRAAALAKGKGAEKQAAPAKVIRELLEEIGAELPEDYLAFLRKRNGYDSYDDPAYDGPSLQLYSADKLLAAARDRDTDLQKHGVLPFGSDGSEIRYAFQIRHVPTHIVAVDQEKSETRPFAFLGTTLEEFLTHLAAGTKGKRPAKLPLRSKKPDTRQVARAETPQAAGLVKSIAQALCEGVAVRADGARAVIGQGAYGGAPGYVVEYDLATQKEVRRVEGAFASGVICYLSDTTVVVGVHHVDLATGTVQERYAGLEGAPPTRHLAASADGRFLVASAPTIGTGPADGGVTLRDASTGREIGRYPGREVTVAVAPSGRVWARSAPENHTWREDGIASDAAVVIHDMAGKRIRVIETWYATHLAFVTDTLLAGSNGNRVHVYDITTGQPVSTCDRSRTGVIGVAASRGRVVLALPTGVAVVDPATGTEVWATEGKRRVGDLVASADGPWAVTGGAITTPGKSLWIWRLP